MLSGANRNDEERTDGWLKLRYGEELVLEFVTRDDLKLKNSLHLCLDYLQLYFWTSFFIYGH